MEAFNSNAKDAYYTEDRNVGIIFDLYITKPHGRVLQLDMVSEIGSCSYKFDVLCCCGLAHLLIISTTGAHQK